MSREIKFRAWDLKRKIMHQVSDLTFRKEWIGCNAFNVEKNEIGDTIGINYFDKRHEDSFVLMQFTGLKDKNGKEIYEGDVLKPTIECGKKLGKIVWLENRSAFGIHWYLQLGTGDIEFCVNDMKMEIVGNIYENPELL